MQIFFVFLTGVPLTRAYTLIVCFSFDISSYRERMSYSDSEGRGQIPQNKNDSTWMDVCSKTRRSLSLGNCRWHGQEAEGGRNKKVKKKLGIPNSRVKSWIYCEFGLASIAAILCKCRYAR